ncbi:MAG: hypothetical protein ACJAT2_003305 [Bacteriovoracaceae bacterium]|jgi:hypothetical protein
MHRKIMATLLSALLMVLSNQALAFELSDRSAQSLKLARPSEFLFQNFKNQELISIRLLGAVNKPGLYHVPKNVNLVTLLTLAGGPTKDADIEKIKIGNDSRSYTGKKSVATFKQKSLTLNLNHAISAGSDPKYNLDPNDIVLVNQKKAWISSDTFRLVSILSVVLSGVLTAIVIDDRLGK